VAAALCAHLLRSYTNAVGIDERSTASVDVAAVGRAIAYRGQPRSCNLHWRIGGRRGIEPFQFSRAFKRHLGLSPARYVERSRIEQAKALIVNAGMSLVNIAQAVGFVDQSHFSRRFRLHEGRTPAEFAREQARGILPSNQGRDP
jgi:AraC family transcriptional regulator